MTSVLVLGSGLIGTSIGLALTQSGWTVLLSDVDPAHVQIAVGKGAGQPWSGFHTRWSDGLTPAAGAAVQGGAEAPGQVVEDDASDGCLVGPDRVDVVVAAGPPSVVAQQLKEAQRLGLGWTYTHVASVQSQVQRQVELLGCDLSSIVGSHPLGGRETSGPRGASADLFAGRAWALCPSALSAPTSLDAVRALVVACGGSPLVASAEDHDRSVALLSHLPQVISSALAAQLVPPSNAPPRVTDGHRVLAELSGPGLVGTTRLAAGSTPLWTDILIANAVHVAPVVRALAGDLIAVADALQTVAEGHAARAPGAPVSGSSTGQDPGAAAPDVTLDEARAAVVSLLQRGVRGRATVAVKRGVGDDGFARVAVHVDDRPGRLAALLTDAGRAGTNVEDVRVDHVPGRPTGAIELLVARESAEHLRRALTAAGWRLVSVDVASTADNIST